MLEKCCSTCAQPISACHCPPPDPPDVLAALFPQMPFPPRSIPRARQRQATAEYRGEQIPAWAFPVVRNVGGYGPPASTDVLELCVYQYEAFLECLRTSQDRIQAMQALLRPEHGRLTAHERKWLYGTLEDIAHNERTLATLYVQAFGMLHDAEPHGNTRRGGREGAEERKRTKHQQHAKIRKEAEDIWKKNPTLSINAVATRLAARIAEIFNDAEKKLSVSQIRRILSSKTTQPSK